MSVQEFVQLLINCREAAQLTKKELAQLSKVSRQTLTNWEGTRPPSKGVPARELNALVRVFRSRNVHVTALSFLKAYGYEILIEGTEDPEVAVVLEAYLTATDRPKELAHLALGLGEPQQTTRRGSTLSRLGETDRQDRQGTQE